MIGVGEDNRNIKFFQHIGLQGLNGPMSSDGHKDGSRDFTVRGHDHSSASIAVFVFMDQLILKMLGVFFSNIHNLVFSKVFINCRSPFVKTIKVICIFSIITLSLLPRLGPDKIYKAQVISVTDGDSLLVLARRRKIKVRMIGVDALELSQGKWGEFAKLELEKLILGKLVTIKKRGIDKYGRVLASVFLGELDLSKRLITKGLALVYPWSDFSSYQKEVFQALQSQAMMKRVGMWRQKLIESPWGFRQKKRRLKRRLRRKKTSQHIKKQI